MRVVARILVVLSLATLPACVDKPTEHRVRANAYLRGGDADKALEEIDSGLKGEPNDISLLILRGKALFELERYDEAKTAYGRAVEVAGSDAKTVGEAHLGLAMVAMRKKDWPAARSGFESMVKINDKDGDAHLNLARVCLQLEDLPCALTHGEKAGHLRGRGEDVLFTLGRIYIAAKKYPEAEKTFRRICEVVENASSLPLRPRPRRRPTRQNGRRPQAPPTSYRQEAPQPGQARRRPDARPPQRRPRLPKARRLRQVVANSCGCRSGP